MQAGITAFCDFPGNLDTLLQIFENDHARIRESMGKGAEAMIELIYNEEKRAAGEEKILREPKNIKQIGMPKEHKKIYIEDYAITFLKQYAQEGENKRRLAVLLGNSARGQGTKHIYIKSALTIDEVEERNGKYVFGEQLWGEIYRQSETYFQEQEIMGWFLSRPGFGVEKNESMEETHCTYFAGADKVFFLMDPAEDETAFYAFDGNRFARQTGYYIYYDKNTPMQSYMIGKKQEEKKEPVRERPDVAMINFRKILKEKEEKKNRRKKRVISFGTKASAVLLLIAGVIAWNGRMPASFDETKTEEEMEITETVEPSVIVEELPGEVEDVEQAEVEELPKEEETINVPVTYEEYTIQPGDTLVKISRTRYGNEEMVDEICDLNDIGDRDQIQIGETILLP